MHKHLVTFACGHSEKVELTGTYGERIKKIRIYGNTCLCSKCRDKERIF